MPECTGIIYRYDGTFAGLLCCIYESYYAHEMPAAIVPPGETAGGLFGEKEIVTDEEKAARVWRSVPERLGTEAANLVRYSFFTCLEEKEMALLRFLRRAYPVGPQIVLHEKLDEVRTVKRAVQHLFSEAHLLKGFVRFSEYRSGKERLLVSVIGPKNFVLPFLANHFRMRLPGEDWLIYDEVHHAAAVGRRGKTEIVPLEELTLAPPDEGEERCRALWRRFYDTIEIKPRHNERCRMSQLPKRYWKYMTEFARSDETGRALPPGGGTGV